MNKTKIIFFCLSILFLNCLKIYAQSGNAKSLSEDPVKIKKYVVDETNTLTTEQTNALLQKLVDFEKATSNQIVFYLIPSLNGEPIELVSIKIAEANKIGKKDKNNGVLLLVSKEEKKIRIEVGYGLEGALTDAISSSIIRNEMAPSFRNGKYYEGVAKGLDAIILATKNEYKNTDKQSDGSSCLGIPIFIIFIFGFIFISIFISIMQKITGLGRKFNSGSRGGFWGGFGGTGSSSGSGGFGGFSGGGGSFGGGGASGGW